jgi:hypothetical protein
MIRGKTHTSAAMPKATGGISGPSKTIVAAIATIHILR